MPVLVPIVIAAAAWGSATLAVGSVMFAGMVAAIGSTLTGMIVGAVVGAAVGAIGAAVTGGDIGKGALWGAVGGAVAGGFAGYSAGGSGPTGAETAHESAMATGNSGTLGNTGAGNTSLFGGAGPSAGGNDGTSLTGGGLMNGMGAAAVTTGGSAIAGMAGGEAKAESQTEALAAADKARQQEFEQRMKEIQANHEASMASITEQTSTQRDIANQNNEAEMARLNTRIGADKETVSTATAKEEAKIAGFNESVRGTDANLFNRPTFNFNPGAEVAQNNTFNSGFAQAAAQSPNATAAQTASTPAASGAAGQAVAANVEPVATITLEQLQAIKEKQAAQVA